MSEDESNAETKPPSDTEPAPPPDGKTSISGLIRRVEGKVNEALDVSERTLAATQENGRDIETLHTLYRHLSNEVTKLHEAARKKPSSNGSHDRDMPTNPGNEA